jgi:hypothetical protein
MADGSRSDDDLDHPVLGLTKVYAKASPEERQRMENYLREIGIGPQFRKFRRRDLARAEAALLAPQSAREP